MPVVLLVLCTAVDIVRIVACVDVGSIAPPNVELVLCDRRVFLFPV